MDSETTRCKHELPSAVQGSAVQGSVQALCKGQAVPAILNIVSSAKSIKPQNKNICWAVWLLEHLEELKTGFDFGWGGKEGGISIEEWHQARPKSLQKYCYKDLTDDFSNWTK